MHWIYFDASALIKRYSQETGTPLVNEVFRLLPRSRMTCSTLGILEIVSVLVRKRNDGRLNQTAPKPLVIGVDGLLSLPQDQTL